MLGFNIKTTIFDIPLLIYLVPGIELWANYSAKSPINAQPLTYLYFSNSYSTLVVYLCVCYVLIANVFRTASYGKKSKKLENNLLVKTVQGVFGNKVENRDFARVGAAVAPGSCSGLGDVCAERGDGDLTGFFLSALLNLMSCTSYQVTAALVQVQSSPFCRTDPDPAGSAP